MTNGQGLLYIPKRASLSPLGMAGSLSVLTFYPQESRRRSGQGPLTGQPAMEMTRNPPGHSDDTYHQMM